LNPQTKSALFGFLNQKPRWSLSLRGWLAVLALTTLSTVAFVFHLHTFLAVNHPLPSDILVVEGWMITDQSFSKVVAEFKNGGYRKAYTTGGEVHWGNASKYGGTYAGYSAARLQHAGIATNSIVSVPSTDRDWERTYLSAIALRDYFRSNNIAPTTLNVITAGPHARRTRLLYQRALGSKISVGIIALPRDDYDPDHWWRTSTGIREVISELAAYLYCRIVPSAFTDS
jgi:hypothetical protein